MLASISEWLRRWWGACVAPRRRCGRTSSAPRRSGPSGAGAPAWTSSASTSPPPTTASRPATPTAPRAPRASAPTRRSWTTSCAASIETAAAEVRAAGHPPARLVLVALGGYGRGELHPSSDLDLMLIHGGEVTPYVQRMAQEILYTLWDLGLRVGHACRSLDDCLALARTDLPSRTSMQAARVLAGDHRLFRALQQTLRREVYRRDYPEFLGPDAGRAGRALPPARGLRVPPGAEREGVRRGAPGRPHGALARLGAVRRADAPGARGQGAPDGQGARRRRTRRSPSSGGSGTSSTSSRGRSRTSSSGGSRRRSRRASATRTTRSAWASRRSCATTTATPAPSTASPRG